jgi:hypothetical protein
MGDLVAASGEPVGDLVTFDAADAGKKPEWSRVVWFPSGGPASSRRSSMGSCSKLSPSACTMRWAPQTTCVLRCRTPECSSASSDEIYAEPTFSAGAIGGGLPAAPMGSGWRILLLVRRVNSTWHPRASQQRAAGWCGGGVWS